MTRASELISFHIMRLSVPEPAIQSTISVKVPGLQAYSDSRKESVLPLKLSSIRIWIIWVKSNKVAIMGRKIHLWKSSRLHLQLSSACEVRSYAILVNRQAILDIFHVRYNSNCFLHYIHQNLGIHLNKSVFEFNENIKCEKIYWYHISAQQLWDKHFKLYIIPVACIFIWNWRASFISVRRNWNVIFKNLKYYKNNFIGLKNTFWHVDVS